MPHPKITWNNLRFGPESDYVGSRRDGPREELRPVDTGLAVSDTYVMPWGPELETSTAKWSWAGKWGVVKDRSEMIYCHLARIETMVIPGVEREVWRKETGMNEMIWSFDTYTPLESPSVLGAYKITNK